LHLKVTAPGHETLTSQLYFEGEEYLTSDAANAVRDGLITSVERTEDAVIATYDFVLEPLAAR
jgi:catechol 1,2-dioxygenase